ncbi:hypothetical protein K503DRAFT_518059 [Rhizopogon vinicolor AM-OR11-026]|uniref:Uncharacterized protein n=1 Tax=Rhizopogon vinicolor AM-OR11-026 TaxID=1314800 RepID=A0A1B7MLQ8_9AGAM|nr:hypothetical protein K503DRAFT_518059 [Rhizopogon vinicolor AM-OR11-026]
MRTALKCCQGWFRHVQVLHRYALRPTLICSTLRRFSLYRFCTDIHLTQGVRSALLCITLCSSGLYSFCMHSNSTTTSSITYRSGPVLALHLYNLHMLLGLHYFTGPCNSGQSRVWGSRPTSCR